MKYWLFIEDKHSEDILIYYKFDTVEELNAHLNADYTPDTYDYIIIEGRELTPDITVKVNP